MPAQAVPTVDTRETWAELSETQKLDMRDIVRRYHLALQDDDYEIHVDAAESLYHRTCHVLAIDPRERESFKQFSHSPYALWHTAAAGASTEVSAQDRADAARIDAVIEGAMEQMRSAGKGLA